MTFLYLFLTAAEVNYSEFSFSIFIPASTFESQDSLSSTDDYFETKLKHKQQD